MPIPGIEQPDMIRVDENIRLRRYDGKIDSSLEWYQDCDMVYMVDGVKEPYTMKTLQIMYAFLDAHGEEYWIEALERDSFRPIGDTTLMEYDMPIVIGDAKYRYLGIGGKVINALCSRAKEIGYREAFVGEIYAWNTASRRCFEKAGFTVYAKTEKGVRMRKEL